MINSIVGLTVRTCDGDVVRSVPLRESADVWRNGDFGNAAMGTREGSNDGSKIAVGGKLGDSVGVIDGDGEGFCEGSGEGFMDGLLVGLSVGGSLNAVTMRPSSQSSGLKSLQTTSSIQVSNVETLVYTPGKWLDPHPYPHDVMPTSIDDPSTTSGPPESPWHESFPVSDAQTMVDGL